MRRQRARIAAAAHLAPPAAATCSCARSATRSCRSRRRQPRRTAWSGSQGGMPARYMPPMPGRGRRGGRQGAAHALAPPSDTARTRTGRTRLCASALLQDAGDQRAACHLYPDVPKLAVVALDVGERRIGRADDGRAQVPGEQKVQPVARPDAAVPVCPAPAAVHGVPCVLDHLLRDDEWGRSLSCCARRTLRARSPCRTGAQSRATIPRALRSSGCPA